MNGKSAVGSVTIWSAGVIIIVQLAQIAGYEISADDQAGIAGLLQSGAVAIGAIISLVGSGSVIWGRVRASKPITSVLPTTP